ncbi:MAG TPA: hypothetical protein VFY37_13565 [Solirubrobacterales bacterium]|nr:hypothetical protein [Solirubrobacterales bacterium]
MSRGSRKQQLIAELGDQFRISGIQDIAFDDATTEQLRLMVDFMREANEVKPRHIERLRRAE